MILSQNIVKSWYRFFSIIINFAKSCFENMYHICVICTFYLIFLVCFKWLYFWAMLLVLIFYFKWRKISWWFIVNVILVEINSFPGISWYLFNPGIFSLLCISSNITVLNLALRKIVCLYHDKFWASRVILRVLIFMKWSK